MFLSNFQAPKILMWMILWVQKLGKLLLGPTCGMAILATTQGSEFYTLKLFKFTKLLLKFASILSIFKLELSNQLWINGMEQLWYILLNFYTLFVDFFHGFFLVILKILIPEYFIYDEDYPRETIKNTRQVGGLLK